MTTHFITGEINLQEQPLKLKEKIEAQLTKEGKPLRWAITEVNPVTNRGKIEAIVTK
jgi:hypothetical protein